MNEVATARRLRVVQLAEEFHVIFVLLSASPVLIFVRSDDDIGLTAPDDVSRFFTCRPQCVMSGAPADAIDNFNAFFSTSLIVFLR